MMLLLLFTATAFSQNKKLEKSYKTNSDVKINLDARHTNVVFETWDKNEVQIEAYVDGKLSSAEAKTLLDSWNFETSGNAGEITIRSSASGAMGKHPDMDVASLTQSMGHLQDMLAPLMTEMVAPMLENIANNPPLPPEFASKMGNVNFDYEAYQKDGEKYMQKFEKQIEEKFGKDFEVSMEKWAEQFEKNAEVWGKNVEKEMEKNGEKFEKSMEKWAESFGAGMEKWGEDFAKQFEGQGGDAPKVPALKGMTKAN
ncbi:hypothetical protein LZ575_08835 [Antarcticibacterium sp. 1MA-6-2]|uniref:hypothetical protein n=1 Tax=Antarcticibacterium sp. 1MA-6-2 TaxID=2908210 RepID=UPI001F3056E0|nr:hypothetical protein [Antarcticibacterium sp. 1MA-6-2]UJH92565.1 hypothetical protein LZ575_08835 [Antarcticibacterium sp. 1MA-6-2]